jgi:hypothetical protein
MGMFGSTWVKYTRLTFEEGTWLTSCRLPWGLLFSSSHGRLLSFICTLSLNLRG